MCPLCRYIWRTCSFEIREYGRWKSGGKRGYPFVEGEILQSLRSGSGWYDLLMGALWLDPLPRSKAKEAGSWLADWHWSTSSSLSFEHQKCGSFSSLVNRTTDGWMDGWTKRRLRWCLISPRNYRSKTQTIFPLDRGYHSRWRQSTFCIIPIFFY